MPWRPGTKPEVLAWRERMETGEGQTTYKHQASTAECVNAQVRQKYRARRSTVRGVAKATSIVLLLAKQRRVSYESWTISRYTTICLQRWTMS